ncbi:MAG: hypothetical protein JRC67_03080 [Deltaproteobacteria bacterium]|nr:hypothetical protein [Deltaproteobacteria bacterium]
MSKEVVMEFNTFLEKCQSEPTVSDFESYLAYCIFEKKSAETCRDQR